MVPAPTGPATGHPPPDPRSNTHQPELVFNQWPGERRSVAYILENAQACGRSDRARLGSARWQIESVTGPGIGVGGDVLKGRAGARMRMHEDMSSSVDQRG